jgi:hypothetical protein
MANINGKTLLTGKISRDRAFAIFDSLPREVKQFYWDRPINGYPSYRHGAAEIPHLRLNDLACIAPTWGPDHPEAQAAAQRVMLKRGKPVEVVSVDDLLDDLL